MTTTKPKTALVTGATGLLGRQVIAAFEFADWAVTGTGFTRASPPFLTLDLSDSSAIAQTLDDVKPTVVVHCMSALPFPSPSTPCPSPVPKKRKKDN